MSYEVTATRRRPQRFEDLVGQEFVADTLKNSIKSGKIAHAYLFAGPRGCGKTSTARILAKALNCQNGPTEEPCGHCSNCLEITKGSSLDVIEIDGASNTSVENIRQIKEEVMFPPNSSKYKIYIIDEVHMLSTSAFNALLKTIEEPPAHVIFIFATTELQKVPATIKSRCQQYNFRLVAIDKVKQCLADAAAELNIQADDEALFWIAKESTGSMRDAYTLFDQVVAFSDGHITYDKIRDKLGLVGIDRLNSLFEACAQNKSDIVINLLDEFLQAGVSIEQLISNSAEYLRSLLLIKNGVKKESLLGNAPERYSSIVLQAWNPIQIERSLSIFLQLYRDIRYSLSPRYELELAFSRLCWVGQYVSSAEVKKAIDAAQRLLMGAAGAGQVNMIPAASGKNTAAVQNTTSNQTNPANQINAINQLNQLNTVSNAAAAAPEAEIEQTEAAEAKKTNLPPGLPKFSFLEKMEAHPELYQNDEEGNVVPAETSETEDPNHPFSDGGSLPPEQSVNNEIQTTDIQTEIEQKLTIHSGDVPADGSAANSFFVPHSETGYSENPDEEYDSSEWATPPDSSSDSSDSGNYSEENASESFDDSAENYDALPVPMEKPVQLQETFTTADGKTLSIAQLRGHVTADLSVRESFTASLLEETGEWKISENSVQTFVSTKYDLSLIEKKIPVISSAVSTICGKPMEFKVSLQQTKINEEDRMKNLPQQVKVLMDVFRGTLVAGK